MLGPRPTPPVVQRDGFQLRQGHFTRINGDIARVSGSRLKELFDPSSLQLEQDRIEAERTAQQLFTKKFFLAQLSHYGIRHSRNIKNPNSGHFRQVLREAVFSGKCDQVPERVTNLKHSMELQLDPIHQQWVIDVEAWEAAKRQEEEEALRNKTPGEKANIDVNWFMEYYFLTNGKPDPHKTPEPLALHGYSDLGWNIGALVNRVPGLALARGGDQLKTTLCIGWGHKAVQALAGKLSAEASAAKRKREKTDRENAMNAHQDYLSRSNQGGSSLGRLARAGNQSPQTSFDLRQCRGSYVVESKRLFRQWKEMTDELGCSATSARPLFTLDIRDSNVAGILTAAVDFATFQGAMILSDSKRKLRDLLRSQGESDEFSDGDYDGEYSTEDEEDEEDEEDDEDDEDVEDEEDEDEDDEDWESDPSPKRQKTTPPSTSRRLFVRTRGSDAGEYYFDPKPGYLDFSDDGYASFCGQCMLAEEPEADLKGYKVSDMPAPEKRGGDFEWPLF